MKCLVAVAMLAVAGTHAEDWQKVAFVGNAKVKSISGLVEVIEPDQRILREGEAARPGQIFRVWRGADIILQMESSKGLVRAKGPVLLRLAPDTEDFSQASAAVGFEVRGIRGEGGRYSADGEHWGNIAAGMILPEGSRVRPFRNSIIDFYHSSARVPIRVSDSGKTVTLELEEKMALRDRKTIFTAKAQ